VAHIKNHLSIRLEYMTGAACEPMTQISEPMQDIEARSIALQAFTQFFFESMHNEVAADSVQNDELPVLAPLAEMPLLSLPEMPSLAQHFEEIPIANTDEEGVELVVLQEEYTEEQPVVDSCPTCVLQQPQTRSRSLCTDIVVSPLTRQQQFDDNITQAHHPLVSGPKLLQADTQLLCGLELQQTPQIHARTRSRSLCTDIVVTSQARHPLVSGAPQPDTQLMSLKTDKNDLQQWQTIGGQWPFIQLQVSIAATQVLPISDLRHARRIDRQIRGTGQPGMSSRLTVECQQAQLVQRFAVHKKDGTSSCRCRPIILQELGDANVREAVIQFFTQYEDLEGAEPWERPLLLIFIDLVSEECSAQQQAQRLNLILEHINTAKEYGTVVQKLAANSICFNDPYTQCPGVSMKQSNEMLVSTIRRGTVTGLNFLRHLRGDPGMRHQLIKHDQGSCQEAQAHQPAHLQAPGSQPAICA
jgi:hypothetical protein